MINENNNNNCHLNDMISNINNENVLFSIIMQWPNFNWIVRPHRQQYYSFSDNWSKRFPIQFCHMQFDCAFFSAKLAIFQLILGLDESSDVRIPFIFQTTLHAKHFLKHEFFFSFAIVVHVIVRWDVNVNYCFYSFK